MSRGAPFARVAAHAAGDDVTLLHVCGRYLPLSETFTYDLIKGLDGCEHHVVATTLENIQHFTLTTVVVPRPEEQAWALAKQVDARAIVCHFGPQATLGMTIALAIDRPAVTIFHSYDISRLLRDRGTRIEGLIREWQLTNVSLLGALEHALTRHEFSQAHLYIQPSITAESGDQEGIPVSLMEPWPAGFR